MTVKLILQQDVASKEMNLIVDSILRAKRVVFVSGAGISCSAGIPVSSGSVWKANLQDFRSLEGLYAKDTGDTKIKGKDLFDVSLFRSAETTSTFYKFMADLRLSTIRAEPTPTHRFLKTLKEQGALLRSYTQNIDRLEERVGLDIDKDVVQLHGDIHTLKCVICSTSIQYNDEAASSLHAGEAPECPSCLDKSAIREAAGRRSLAVGTLRPDIVLYGEDHPCGDVIAKACAADLRRRPDCLLIAGTSLKIPGFKRLIKDFAKSVHKQKGKVILLNMTDVLCAEWNDVIDYYVEGGCDDFVDHMKSTRPEAFKLQTTLEAIPKTKSIMSINSICNSTKLCQTAPAKACEKVIKSPTSKTKKGSAKGSPKARRVAMPAQQKATEVRPTCLSPTKLIAGRQAKIELEKLKRSASGANKENFVPMPHLCFSVNVATHQSFPLQFPLSQQRTFKRPYSDAFESLWPVSTTRSGHIRQIAC